MNIFAQTADLFGVEDTGDRVRRRSWLNADDSPESARAGNRKSRNESYDETISWSKVPVCFSFQTSFRAMRSFVADEIARC